MKNKFSVGTILLITVMVYSLMFSTMGNVYSSITIPSPTVDIDADSGKFVGINYYVASTGAIYNGIRYRTKAVTIIIGTYTVTIPYPTLIKDTPAAGVQSLAAISITSKMITDNANINDLPAINKLLSQKTYNISVGAIITIYNAATGQVKATISNVSEVDSIGRQFGFGQQHLDDMKSRFLDNSKAVPTKPIPTTTNKLRPSVLIPDQTN